MASINIKKTPTTNVNNPPSGSTSLYVNASGDLSLKDENGKTTDYPTTKVLTTVKADVDGRIDDLGAVIVRHEAEIDSIENTLNSANINQETSATVTGVDTIALPKTAANTGMQVQMFGQSAQNLVVNGDFRNGTNGWYTAASYNIVVNGILTSTGSGESSDPSVGQSIGAKSIGDKSYFKASVTAKTALCIRIDFISDAIIASIINPSINTKYNLSGVITAPSINETAIVYHNYASAADANGSAIEVENFVAINLTATFGAGNEPTKEQCDLLFANYFEGTDNVLGTGRVRSVGKNLFDTTNVTGTATAPNYWYRDADKLYWLDGGAFEVILQNRVEVKESTYTVSGKVFLESNSGTVGFSLRFFNSGGTQLKSKATDISGLGLKTFSITDTAPAGTAYCLVIMYTYAAYNSKGYLYDIQLERSATATTYEPYRESILQLTTPPLRSNGLIKDEIRKGTNGYELVKRVGVGTLGANGISGGDFEGGLIGTRTEGNGSVSTWTLNTTNPISGTRDGRLTMATAGTGTGRPFITFTSSRLVGELRKFSFSYKLNTGSTTLLVFNNGSLVSSPILSFPLSGSGVFSSYYVVNGSESLILYLNGQSLYDIQIDNLKDELIAAAGLTTSRLVTELGSNVHYTLTTPVITPIPHAGLLNSNANGTAYFEPIIADAGVYSTNLTVQLTDYPIASFESIRKYSGGTYTELNTATAVIAGDGLSFTHPDLASGDLVMFTYAYANESIGRSMILSYSISNSNPYYNVTNSVPLTTGYYTSTTARLAVPEGVRKTGLILTYETSAGVWYTERYIGTATDTTSFTTAGNWEIGVLRMASVTDTTEYAEITI